MEQQDIIAIRGMTKNFPGVLALDGVDFSLRRGEIHSLMGENGAGKSTLIKVITGVYSQDSGVIEYAGSPFSVKSPQEARARGISTVYQEVNLIPTLSVAENIFIGRQPRKFGAVDWKTMNDRAEAAMAELDIRVDPRKPLEEYSTAVQQMISIARAVDGESKVLILDEPTSSLDSGEVEKLFAVMRRLRDRGLGIIFVSHFLDQIYEITDRITVLRNGRLVGVRDTAKLDRLELIAMMLGQEGGINPVASEKFSRFVGKPSAVAAEGTAPVVRAKSIARGLQVQNVDLEFRPGEIVGFAGLLGSGRTETARLLFGADKVESGSVEIRGERCSLGSPREAILKGIGFCPEDRKALGILGELSIRENLIMALQAKSGVFRTMSRKRQEEITERYIKALNIKTPGPNQKIKNLSGGNQQKVIVARWLASDPDFLILDEPTRGIDVGAKLEIQKLILQLAEKGMSLLFISSELAEVVRCSNRVCVFRDHRKLGEISGDDVNEAKIMETIAGGAS